MSTPSLVTIQQGVKFSQSLYWEYQLRYFYEKGIEAWSKGEVPYYITSNAFIAYCYSHTVLRFLQDGLRNKTIDPSQPIYLIELGTGSGKFSYLFLRQMSQFLKHFGLDHLKFCYVMTDFTESNLKYWESNTQFKEFVDQGILDFAIYRIGEKQSIRLIHQGVVLDEGSVHNPLIAIGNYIFDTVPHDIIRVKGGKLEEGLLNIKTPGNNLKENNEVIALDKLEPEFEFKEIQLPYYQNEHINHILAYYQQHLIEGTFLVPVGGLQCLDTLRALSNNKLFLITSDKGYTSVESMEGLGTPHIAFHGSLSTMVNFDFMGRYIEALGGETLLAADYEGMKVSLMSLGGSFKDMIETVWANDQFNEHLCTREFLLIKNKLIADPTKLDLEEMMALLKFSYWDPDIFMAVCVHWASILGQASVQYIQALRVGLGKISRNYYFVQNGKNVPFELGRFFHLTGDSEKAIHQYQASLAFGEDSATYFNMGLCHYHRQELAKALSYFKLALSINNQNKAARDWMIQVERELKSQGAVG